MSRDWEFMVETCGDITGIEVTAAFTFSKDFKMKSAGRVLFRPGNARQLVRVREVKH